MGEDDWFDLVFRLTESKREPDGARSFQADGTYAGSPVGFEVLLPAGWNSPRDGGFGTGVVIIRSRGEVSDAFLKALDTMYGTKLSPRTMRESQRFNAVSMQGDVNHLEAGRLSLKLFYEVAGSGEEQTEEETESSAEAYAEFYINIEIAKNRLELREKDPDYRRGVVQSLSAP